MDLCTACRTVALFLWSLTFPCRSELTPPAGEAGVDHAGIIRGWNDEALARGEKLYRLVCITCHGTPDAPGSLPNSRAFWKETFRNGSDPYSLFQTITNGLGQMPPWPMLTPQQRYDVIHFVREKFVRTANPKAYHATTPEYLAGLPRPKGEFQESAEMKEFARGPLYLRMHFGPVLFWTLEAAPGNIAYKGIAVRLDDGPGGISKGRAWMLYDHDTMRVAAAWSGEGFVDWRGIAFDGSHGTHTAIVGRKAFVNPPGPGWAKPGTLSYEDPRILGLDNKPYGPLPREWVHFQSTHLCGNRAVITYRVHDAEVQETPSCEVAAGRLAFLRTLHVGKSSVDLEMRLAPDAVEVSLGPNSGAKLTKRDGFHLLQIPAAATPLSVTVKLWDPQPVSVAGIRSIAPGDSMDTFLRGGAARWPNRLVTAGVTGKPDNGFAVDALTLPADKDNPWHTWMRLSGFDFFADGRRAAVCTWLGDVWIVSGIDGDLSRLRWQRVASGLHQPLGLRIVDEVIHVCCRDMIARLRDLNGDGEADVIENFNSDHQVTEHFHEFAMGLQTDLEGNFYYAKSARHALPPLVPQHGTLLKVSADGSRTDIVASGFRAANGVCVNDDGTFFVTDQEGHWTPKNRINLVKPGGFYGNMWSFQHPESSGDEAMEQPLAWITNAMDRSPGELVRITPDNWGPLKGGLLNLSYGMGQIFLVMTQQAGSQMQAGVCRLPIPDFPTGVMRGRFHPGNGHLYACGMTAWASNKSGDGGFFRVRKASAPSWMPVGLNVHPDTISLTFSDALNPQSATAPKNYAVKAWDLHRSAGYGSPHVKEHPLTVAVASLSLDGKTVELNIPGLAPTRGMELRCSLRSADGIEFERVIHNTIHALPARNP